MPTSSKQQAAAKAAGLRYYHVPFNGARPDAKVAQQFLAAITTKGAEPAFIHCASANRASAMWLIKRIVIDHWDVERATTEATALGLSNGALRTWALDYARTAKQSVHTSCNSTNYGAKDTSDYSTNNYATKGGSKTA